MDRSLTLSKIFDFIKQKKYHLITVLIIITIFCSIWFMSHGTSYSENNSTSAINTTEFVKTSTSLTTTQETTTTILPIITRDYDSVFDYLIDAVETSETSLTTIQATNATILPIITLNNYSVFDYDSVFDYLIDGNENFETMSKYRYETKTTEFVKTKSIPATTVILPMIKRGWNYNNVFNNLIFFDKENRTIKIQPHENVNLTFLFEAISNIFGKNKRLDQFTIENKYIEKLEENFSGSIRIYRIRIINCPKLKYIHRNSFGNQAKSIKYFYAAANLTSIHDSDYDLFKLINSMKNCEEIIMNPFDNELRTIKLKKLKKLSFDGLYS